MQLILGDIAVDLAFKDIKNVHLSVYPPEGKVRISAPRHMSVDSIRLFALSKLVWIRQQQKKLQEQKRETPREYLDHESHYVWGKRYLLVVFEEDKTPAIELNHKHLVFRVRPGTEKVNYQKFLDGWYREQIMVAVPPLIAKWEPILGVKVARVYVQQMKTRWGSCNHGKGNIRLNTDLAKKPRECLEYIVVHEMLHLLEPTHNVRFTTLIDHFLPDWHLRRDLLNQLPVRHEKWGF